MDNGAVPATREKTPLKTRQKKKKFPGKASRASAKALGMIERNRLEKRKINTSREYCLENLTI
jgi:hypothetical protein